MMPQIEEHRPDQDVDAMVRDMKRANRKPLFIAMSFLAGACVLLGLYIQPFQGAWRVSPSAPYRTV